MRFLATTGILALTSLNLSLVLSAKIIFLFTGGNLSHKISIWPLVFGLAQRGHQVTFLSSHSKSLQPHSNIIDVAPELLAKASESAYNINRFKNRVEGNDVETVGQYDEACLKTCQALLHSNDTSLNNIIDNVEQYDLAIVSTLFGECGTLIASNYGSKMILFSSTTILPWYHTPFALPWEEASYIPDNMGRFTSYPLGYLDRIQNLLLYFAWSDLTITYTIGLENLMKERFGFSEVSSFLEMQRKASLVFYNAHHSIDFARALPPMFIPIGGMQCWDAVGVLPKNFQDFMNGAVGGVVLISFGSTVDLSILSEHYLNIFFNMMRKFSRVRFIWRWKGKISKNAPNNLMGAEWLPQKEILNHPNIRAFMTHCGLNSVTEATCFGVPLIGIPLFADQDFTAYRLEAQEIGVKIEIKGLTQEDMNLAVEKILSNPKYKINMLSRSAMLKDQPQSPIETAIFWTEFVLRHDDVSSLKPMALEQPWYVRQLLDVYFGIFVIIIVLPLWFMFMIILFVKTLVDKHK